MISGKDASPATLAEMNNTVPITVPMDQALNPSAAKPEPSAKPAPKQLIDEIAAFRKDCESRYRFNSRWDNALNIFGIALSVAIVASGVFKLGALSAILGAFVAAIVTAQKAFPFSQRAVFYRNMIGQAENLSIDAGYERLSLDQTIAVLKSLKLDFAQQLPRGASFDGGAPSNKAA